MKRLIAALAIIVTALALSGCGYKEVNQQIATSNENRLRIYSAGMAACQKDPGCQVGLTAAFAGNMGMQEFIKPESGKDYMVAGIPILNILTNWINPGQSGSGVMVSGTGNSVTFMKGNTMADTQNYVQMTPTTTQEWNTYTGTDEWSNTGTYSYDPGN